MHGQNARLAAAAQVRQGWARVRRAHGLVLLLRSLVVDLLEVSGAVPDEAAAALPHL